MKWAVSGHTTSVLSDAACRFCFKITQSNLVRLPGSFLSIRFVNVPSIGRPAKTYVYQFCTDTGCSQEDLPEEMQDRDRWWERKSPETPCYENENDDDTYFVFFLCISRLLPKTCKIKNFIHSENHQFMGFHETINKLIDFNGMLNRWGLSYAMGFFPTRISFKYESSLNRSSWLIYGTLTETATPGHQSGTGSNCNERIFNIPQNSRTGASASDPVYFYTQYISFFEGEGLTPLLGDTVSIF